MPDENRMITFNYARTTWDVYKKQIVPSSNECMTKSDIINYFNVDTSVLNNYTNNQLIRRDKFVGITLNTPTTFGNLTMTTYQGSNIVPGYTEYNRIKNAYDNVSLQRLNLCNINSSANTPIYNSSFNQVATISMNKNGSNFMSTLLNKVKELAGWSNLTGWTLQIRINGSMINAYNASFAQDVSPSGLLGNSNWTFLEPTDINNYITEANANYQAQDIIFLTKVINGFTPIKPTNTVLRFNNQLSHHSKIDICPSGVSNAEQQNYMKPTDSYDTNGFYTLDGSTKLYNTDFLYFGCRQVIGSNNYYTSAPAGTPNFPRGCGVTGAFDVRYIFMHYRFVFDFRAVNGGTTVDLGKITFNMNEMPT